MWQQLFDYGSFITRNHCGVWPAWLISINQAANFSIFMAYTIISASLMFLWLTKRRDLWGHWIILCFVAFIFACGITHLCNFVAFYVAPYKFFTLVDSITAIISVSTAAILPYIVKKISRFKPYVTLVEDLDKCKITQQSLEDVLKREYQRKAHKKNVLESILRDNSDLPPQVSELIHGLIKELELE